MFRIQKDGTFHMEDRVCGKVLEQEEGSKEGREAREAEKRPAKGRVVRDVREEKARVFFPVIMGVYNVVAQTGPNALPGSFIYKMFKFTKTSAFNPQMFTFMLTSGALAFYCAFPTI